VIFAWVSFLWGWITSAETGGKACEGERPSVCWATPDTLIYYLDFQREMSSALQTEDFKSVVETIQESEKWIFSNWLLKLGQLENFENTLAGKSLQVFYKTAERTTISILTLAYLFELSAISASSDNTIYFTILFHDRPIVRDWSRVLDVEWNLSKNAQRIWDMWQIQQTMESTKPFQEIIKKYQGKWLLSWWSNLPPSMKYTDLITELAFMNASVKRFIAYDATGAMSNLTWYIKFNDEWIESISKDYECARWWLWFKCNSKWKSIGENLKQLTSNTKKQGVWSWKKIKKSSCELYQALWFGKGYDCETESPRNKEQWYLTEKEKKVLENVYWIDTSSSSNQRKSFFDSILWAHVEVFNWWKSSSKSANYEFWITKTPKDLWNTAKSWAKSIWAWVTAWWKAIWKVASRLWNKLFWKKDVDKKDSEKLKINSIKIEDMKRTEFWTGVMKNIEELFVARQNIEASISNATNTSLTRVVSVIVTDVNVLMETIGDKDKKGTLRHTLYDVCTYQCQNKQGPCYTP